MRYGRLIAIFLCSGALALTATACGGGGGTKYEGTNPDEWSNTVCTAVADWVNGLKADSQKFQNQVGNNSGNLATIKAKLATFLRQGESRSATLVQQVHDAGAPAVKDGPAIQSDLEKALGETKTTFATAATQTSRLPTNNPKAFSDRLSSIFGKVQADITAAGEELTNLDKKYNTTQLDDAQACKNLPGS